MRIALLSRYALPFHFQGGLQRYAYDVARQLERAGVEVVLFCEPPDSDAWRGSWAPTAHFVRHRRVPGLGRVPGTVILDRISNYFLFARAAAREMVAAHRLRPFDAIYAQGLGAWGVARVLADFGEPSPRLACFHHGMEEFKNPDWRKRMLYAPFRAAIRSATRRAAVVIVTDAGARRETRELLGFEPAAFAEVPAGIDLAEIESLRDEALASRWMERLGLPERRPLILSVARLEVNKGIDVAIDALALVADTLPPRWRWAIVGEGSQRAALEARARDRGLSERIAFLGGISDAELHNLYPLADLFVHPTLFEGTSLVTVEAMAHRLPVVASRAGGIPQKIESGRNGVLVPPGDVGALGAAVASVLSSDDRGRALGAAARADVESRFAWPRVVDRLLAALIGDAHGSRTGERAGQG